MLSSVYNLEIGENSRIELSELFLSVIHSIHILSGMKANLVIGTTKVAENMSDFENLDFPMYECISTFCLDFGDQVGGCVDVLIFYSNNLRLTEEEKSLLFFGGAPNVGFPKMGPGVPNLGPGGAAEEEEEGEEGEEEEEDGGPDFGKVGPGGGGEFSFLLEKGGVGKNLVVSRLSGKFFEGKPYVLTNGVFGVEGGEKREGGKEPIVTWFADQGEGVHLRDLEVRGVGKLRVVSVDSINHGDYEAFPDRLGKGVEAVGLAGLYLLCLIDKSETLGGGVCNAACITDVGREEERQGRKRGVWPVKYRRDHRVCFNFAKGADIYEIVMEGGGGEGEGVFIFGQGVEGGTEGKRVELGLRGDGTQFVLMNGVSLSGGVQNLEFSETLARKIKEVNYIYLQANERVKTAHLGENFLTVVEN